jgi:hypothetical protein
MINEDFLSHQKRLPGTYRHKEIRRGLSVCRLVAHVHEVLLRLRGGAKVSHAALINDADLVEQLEQRLSGLVDRNDGCEIVNVGSNAQGSDESLTRGQYNGMNI